MKKINLFVIILIGLIINTSCSSNDSSDSNITNGFTVNGTPYATDIAIAGQSFPYRLRFSNTTATVGDNIQSGAFYLMAQSTESPLTTGAYSTGNGPEGMYGISGYDPITFVDTSAENHSLGTSGYWHNDDEFISGNVTINSLTLSSEEPIDQIIQIDISYSFKWDGVTINGNYSGEVLPEN